MLDIIFLELIIAFLLFLTLLRPYIKTFWAIDGISFFPLCSLMICLGMFGAYGFRPECIPLFLCVIAMFVYHLPAVVSILQRLKNDTVQPGNIIITIAGIFLAAGSLAVALCFLPLVPEEISMDGITQVSLQDDNREYFVRIYNPPTQNDEEKQPFIIVAPPVMNSMYFSDKTCRFLAENGFIALTFSRKGLDVSAINNNGRHLYASMFKYMKMFSMFGKEFSSIRANLIAKSLEDERMRDIRFILSYIKQNIGKNSSPLFQFDEKTLILAGFSESGAAITQLVSESAFTQNYPHVSAFINIEAPLASSSVLEAIREIKVDENASFREKLMIHAENLFVRLKPKKIIGSAVTVFPQIPSLYITSDKMNDAAFRESRYSSITQLNRGSTVPTLLAAVSGAAPLDFTGLSSVYPILRFLSGDPKSTEAPNSVPDTAAQLIVNYSLMIISMRNSEMRTADISRFIKRNIEKDIYLETQNF